MLQHLQLLFSPVSVFILCYALFVVLPNRRSLVACIGAALLVLTGTIGWHEALTEKISWNVMGLFFGTLILAELFILSRVPALLAEWLVDRSSSARIAMLALCALSGVISMAVENVAVVLIVAPIALSLADKLKINPVPLLIGIAISSNIQGTATMIGDPPSMILAGYMQMGFWDFFVYQGKPGIFFAVQVGAVGAMLVLAFLFRRHCGQVKVLAQEDARSWVPSILMVVLIFGLSLASIIDPDFKWFAGVFTLAVSAVSVIWFRSVKWGSTRSLCGALDWNTTFFLIGVFVIVGGLSDSGWMDRIADLISASAGSSVLAAFLMIVLVAVIISGFVDNVPFLLVMIPVVQRVAGQMDVPVQLLMYGLLVGACLGGNLTPIGASANVVTMGILRKSGHTVGFREFMYISVPFTIVAVICSCLFVWFIWR
jgi:Na+/H+ antiporter NhaD/arsenite permease-like protein